MPRQKMAMKDVEVCEKPRGAVNQALIRGCPNGETQLALASYLLAEYIGLEKQTQGIETSQYLEEKKSKEIPSVAASERGRAQTTLL